jgi:hypothetical protein
MSDIVEIDRSRLLKEDVCNAFGVPPSKLQRTEANRASAETADVAHARDAGLPRCAANAGVLNAQLLPMYPTAGRLFFAYDSPVPEDKEAAREDRKVGVAQSAAVAKLQSAVYATQLPREAAVQQAVIVLGFAPEQAEELFPNVKLPKPPEPNNKPGGGRAGDDK